MFQLAAHQREAIAKLHTGSVLVGDVGTGKSIASMAYFTEKHPDRKIIVITTAKKRDSGEWYGDAMKMSLRNHLHVDSWNNIKQYEDVTDASFIFDEQRVVGSGPWVNAFLKICKQNDWILLSATPADVWMDLLPVFLANGFFRNKTEFINSHVVYSRFTKYPKVDKYINPYILEKYRNQIYVEMYLERHTTRVEHLVDVEFDLVEQQRLWRDRWNIYENQPIKDAGELMRLLRKSANTHPSRIEALKKIAAEHPKLIVFYNHNYELEILRCLMTELDIPMAEWNGHNHQDVPTGDRWMYLVQYQAGSEGWNCVTTDTIVFYSLPYSYRQFHQAKGRIDRMNTPFTIMNYYIFKSKAIVDIGIWRALHRKKNFHVSAFVKKVWPKPSSLQVKHQGGNHYLTDDRGEVGFLIEPEVTGD